MSEVNIILLRLARPCSASRRDVYTAYTSSEHSQRLSLWEHDTPETYIDIIFCLRQEIKECLCLILSECLYGTPWSRALNLSGPDLQTIPSALSSISSLNEALFEAPTVLLHNMARTEPKLLRLVR